MEDLIYGIAGMTIFLLPALIMRFKRRTLTNTAFLISLAAVAAGAIIPVLGISIWAGVLIWALVVKKSG